MINYRCITNNPMVYKKNLPFMEFVEGIPLDLFIIIKNEILKGHKLITHPLTSSLTPNYNPYKTVFLSRKRKYDIDIESLRIIDNAIKYTNDLIKNHHIPEWDEKSLEDFQIIDFDIIKEFLDY